MRVTDLRSKDFSPLLVASVPLFYAVLYFMKGFSPTHDAISWQGAYHYFYSQIQNGIMPYWNPYSQTGTPFFVYYQSFGLLDPFNFLFIGIGKLTGCSTLTAYILYYFFCYYVFVLGTYYTLKSITEDRSTSFVFSMILSLACAPTFFRQNGALLPFYLIPFITYCVLSFFKESDVNKKGVYLLMTLVFCAITMNIHIAAGLLFYLFLLLLLAFVLGIGSFKETVAYVTSKRGSIWLLISFAVFVLIVLPVGALYLELHHDNELFPTVRFLQKNGNNLVRLYASDLLSKDVFNSAFTNDLKTSITTGNLLGLIFEPYQHVIYNIQSSEIKLFLGTFPLVCLVLSITGAKDRRTYLFAAMALFILFIMCNFRTFVVTEFSFLQAAMATVFPLLKMMEVYQNLGILFLFCLTVVGALGFRRIRNETKLTVPVFYVAIGVIFLKYFMLFVFWASRYWDRASEIMSSFPFEEGLSKVYAEVLRKVLFLSGLGKNLSIDGLHSWLKVIVPLVVICAAGLVYCIVKYRRRLVRFALSIRPAYCIATILILLSAELIVFDYVYMKNHRFGSRDYYRFLRNEHLLKTKSENPFLVSRDPFVVPASRVFPPNNTFFGYEIFEARKVMFPVTMLAQYLRTRYSLTSREYRVPSYDHFYMTKYYYDYISGIELDRQLATSGAIFPIINFVPESKAVPVSDKYEIVSRINASRVEDLGGFILIEKAPRTRTLAFEKSVFYEPVNCVAFTEEDAREYRKYSNMRYSGNNSAVINVKDHSVNHLRVSVDASTPGYLFFGDGYSRHWKAFVDDRRASIEKTNINFKSVFVPAGKHEVFFRYDPLMFRYSLYMYFAGLSVVVAVLLLFGVYRRRGDEK
jgi:hypothetical protein